MLTPSFSDAGISVFDIPHSSCGGLGYKVTVRSGGVIEDVQLTERTVSVADFMSPQNDFGLGPWKETGHGKLFESAIPCGTSTSGLLKLIDYGGSIGGSVDLEAPVIPLRDLPRSSTLCDLPAGPVGIASGQSLPTGTLGPHNADMPCDIGRTSAPRRKVRMKRPDLSLKTGPLTTPRKSFRLQKPKLWLEMEKRYS